MIKNKLKNWATSGSPSSRLVYFLVFICWFISGLCTLLLPLTLLQLMDKWPGIRGTYFIELASLSTTQGRITRSEVISDYTETGEELSYRIAYEFEYGGKRYSSDQITFKNEDDNPPEYVQGLVAKYPLGGEVTVSVDENLCNTRARHRRDMLFAVTGVVPFFPIRYSIRR